MENFETFSTQKEPKMSPPPPSESEEVSSLLNAEAKLFVPGVGMVTPPPKEKKKTNVVGKVEEKGGEEISPLNWELNARNGRLQSPFTTPPVSTISSAGGEKEATRGGATKVIAFTPAMVKERKDDPFDKEIYLQKAVTLVKEEFKAASLLHDKNNINNGEMDETTTRTTEIPLRVEVVPAASSEDEEPTPRESKMLSKPLLFNERQNSDDDERGGTSGVKEYGTHQPQNVETLFPEESRVPLLAVSAEKKREEQYVANEEDIPDELLWTKETLAPLLGGGLNSIKTVNTRTGEDDKEEELATSVKLTFTNYGADDENVVADWGDAKVPLLSASAGNTPRYLDGGGGLLSRQGPFSYGTAATDEVEERVATSSSSGGYSSGSESESSSGDDDEEEEDDDGKENRQHSAKLLLEQFLMSEKKQKKHPIGMGYKQNRTSDIASTRARETTAHSIQFKPLLKTPPRLKKVAHHQHEQPPQQRSQTTQTERESRRQNTSSPYTLLTTHAAELRRNTLRDDLCCVFHAVLVSRPEILEKHLALSSASPSSSLRNRVASLEPRRSTRRRLDRFEANVESFMVFALGEEDDKGHQQLVSFDAFARAMRVAATAAARMTTLEGVRDAVNILSDFESLFTQDCAYSSIVRECLTSATNADQMYRHRCSRRLRAYKSIVSILNKIKRYDQLRSQESNITVDRVCLLLAAIDGTDTESESQEDYSTTTTSRDGENDAAARYVYHLVSSAKRKLSAEVESGDTYERVQENNGYNKISSSIYNSDSIIKSMPLSEVIARRRQMVDAWFETQRF